MFEAPSVCCAAARYSHAVSALANRVEGLSCKTPLPHTPKAQPVGEIIDRAQALEGAGKAQEALSLVTEAENNGNVVPFRKLVACALALKLQHNAHASESAACHSGASTLHAAETVSACVLHLQRIVTCPIVTPPAFRRHACPTVSQCRYRLDLQRRMQAADGLDRRFVSRAIALDAGAAATPQPNMTRAAGPPGMLALPALPDSMHTDGTVSAAASTMSTSLLLALARA